MIRICPERDAACPHGMNCPYSDGYRCKAPIGEEVKRAAYLVERLKLCADDLMWADHAEVSKSLLNASAAALEALSKELALKQMALTEANSDALSMGANFYAAQTDLEAAEATVTILTEVLKPFADMAGEMFARGWDASNVALALDNPGDAHRVTAGDFFAARAAIQSTGRSAG